jgi:hypothetical protein
LVAYDPSELWWRPAAFHPGPFESHVGETAELLGYGATSSGSVGTLNSVHETIVGVGTTSIIVDGEGKSGACGGDSGGALVVEGLLAGVLTLGSPDCRGIDEYLRVDHMSDWLGRYLQDRQACPDDI